MLKQTKAAAEVLAMGVPTQQIPARRAEVSCLHNPRIKISCKCSPTRPVAQEAWASWGFCTFSIQKIHPSKVAAIQEGEQVLVCVSMKGPWSPWSVPCGVAHMATAAATALLHSTKTMSRGAMRKGPMMAAQIRSTDSLLARVGLGSSVGRSAIA